MPRRARVLGMGGWIVSVLALAWALSLYDGRASIDLSRFLEVSGPEARLVTGEICSYPISCEQALVSENWTMYQFEDGGQAAAAAAELGDDARLAGWIVVEFTPGRTTTAERNSLMRSVYCLHNSAGTC